MNNIMYPFGPPVYLSKVDDEIIQELDVRIEETGGKPEFDASGQLAGRIKKQTHIDEVISTKVRDHILNHCKSFYEQTSQDEIPLTAMVLDSIWSNFPEARDYKRQHQHTGNFSFVIYTRNDLENITEQELQNNEYDSRTVSYTHLRAHETS